MNFGILRGTARLFQNLGRIGLKKNQLFTRFMKSQNRDVQNTTMHLIFNLGLAPIVALAYSAEWQPISQP